MEYCVAPHSGHYWGADSQSVEGKKRDGAGAGGAAVLSIFYALMKFLKMIVLNRNLKNLDFYPML